MRALPCLLLLACTACRGDLNLDRDPATAYRQLMQLTCERQVECGVVVMNQLTSVEACAAENSASPLLTSDTPLALDRDAIVACAAAVDSASCGTLANRHLVGLAACAKLSHGTLGEGEACTATVFGEPCAEGLLCTASVGSCGTCLPAPARCMEGTCPMGFYCDGDRHCVLQHALGEVCERLIFTDLWEQSCAKGTFCGNTGPEDRGPPHCLPQAASGEACVLASRSCADGTSCHFGGGCEPEKEVGVKCSWYGECAPGLACAGTCVERHGEGGTCGKWLGECAPGLGCDAGTCRPKPDEVVVGRDTQDAPVLKLGARCDEARGLCPLGTSCRCSDHTTCATMTCIPGPKLGESCAPFVIENGEGGETTEDLNDPYACSEGYCDFLNSRTCVAPVVAGEPCSYEDLTLTFECASLLCEHRVCRGLVDPTCN